MIALKKNLLIVLFLILIGFEFGYSTVSTPSPVMSEAPEVQESIKIEAGVNREKLLKSFEEAQKTEWKAFLFRQKTDLKDLKASQKSRLKSWKISETQARRKYFEENIKSTDRRMFMIDSKKRYDAFLVILKDELDSRTRDWNVRAESLKQDQAHKLKVFKEELGKGNRPEHSLWPTNGGY